jgi:hypothetical protein
VPLDVVLLDVVLVELPVELVVDVEPVVVGVVEVEAVAVPPAPPVPGVTPKMALHPTEAPVTRAQPATIVWRPGRCTPSA